MIALNNFFYFSFVLTYIFILNQLLLFRGRFPPPITLKDDGFLPWFLEFLHDILIFVLFNLFLYCFMTFCVYCTLYSCGLA